MNLWIRSQDREKLVLTKGFETQHTNYDGGCQIFAVWENNYQMVGKYKTKKRALEVLDEIQKKLNARKESECSVEYILIDNIAQVIYEMPQE